MKLKLTHTHTHIYIYIYIYIELVGEVKVMWLLKWAHIRPLIFSTAGLIFRNLTNELETFGLKYLPNQHRNH
jgi:hypothetical protein